MKPKMFIFILTLLLPPLANSSCDPNDCKVGTSAGSGVCQVGAAVGGAVACGLGGWFTFGLSCVVGGAIYAGVGAACAAVGDVVGNACNYCASDDAPDFQEIANKVDGLELNVQEISDKLDGTEQNFQDIFKKLDGTDHKFKEIFQKLDGTEQNLEEITNKLNGFEQNFEEFKDKMDLKFQRITNKLDCIEQTLVENHLKQEAWFHQLVENDKNLILRQGKMIVLQQTTVGQLDQLIRTTETLGNKIEHSQTISLYGQDFKRVRNVRTKFKLLTRGNSGLIVNDRRAKVFRETALRHTTGSEDTINNIFLMLSGGHPLKKESIYETPGGKYCKPEIHKYFVDVLVEALTLHTTALAMEGYTLSTGLSKKFNEDIVKATSAYNRHCDCAPGLKKANRGQVSTLLDRLPSGSQNLNQKCGPIARVENSVMRIKMDLIFAVKNFEPNKVAENILENHSVEDIELVVASVKNKKEDLKLHDFADICVDKERNKVKTSAAFTPDSFVNGCVPPQTLDHGRFLCLEDGVTCHVVCDKDYALETTDKRHMFMECLDNTWTPLPTTFKCALKTVIDCVSPQTLEHGRFLCLEDGVTCHVVCDKGYGLETTDTRNMMECLDNTWTPLPTTFKCLPGVDGGWSHWGEYGKCSKECGGGKQTRMRTCTNPVPQHNGRTCEQQNIGDASEVKDCNLHHCVTCRGGATSLSTSPGRDMVVCKDKTVSTCQKDFESLCPAGWNLCTPGQFNNRNDGWTYNWDPSTGIIGGPLGVIYCVGDGYARHYGIYNAVLNTDQRLNCWVTSSRPGCELLAGVHDCDEKDKSALCCAPSRTCGDGLVQQEEDCDDGNRSNNDDCLNSCTWKTPRNHGHSGCG